MTKLLVICPYPERQAPSQRLKYEQYFDSWRKEGYEITVCPFFDSEFWRVIYKKGQYHKKAYFTIRSYFKRYFLLFSIRKYDVIYIHLWGTPLGLPIFEYLLSWFSGCIIYDIDDMVFLSNPSHFSPLISMFKGKTKPICLMKLAKHVIVCTPALEKVAKKYNHNVTDISSTIDTDNYLPKNNYENGSEIVLGWSGSLSTSKYLNLLKSVIVYVGKIKNVKLLVIGDPEFAMEGVDVESLPWVLNEEVAQLVKIDIGLYPLPDEPWVYGKSGLKALQYMALGIPTIASAVGTNFRVIEDGVDGFLVGSEQEWIDRILMLIDQPNLRKIIGANARKKVEMEYSVNTNSAKYLKILNDVRFQ